MHDRAGNAPPFGACPAASPTSETIINGEAETAANKDQRMNFLPEITKNKMKPKFPCPWLLLGVAVRNFDPAAESFCIASPPTRLRHERSRHPRVDRFLSDSYL